MLTLTGDIKDSINLSGILGNAINNNNAIVSASLDNGDLVVTTQNCKDESVSVTINKETHNITTTITDQDNKTTITKEGDTTTTTVKDKTNQLISETITTIKDNKTTTITKDQNGTTTTTIRDKENNTITTIRDKENNIISTVRDIINADGTTTTFIGDENNNTITTILTPQKENMNQKEQFIQTANYVQEIINDSGLMENITFENKPARNQQISFASGTQCVNFKSVEPNDFISCGYDGVTEIATYRLGRWSSQPGMYLVSNTFQTHSVIDFVEFVQYIKHQYVDNFNKLPKNILNTSLFDLSDERYFGKIEHRHLNTQLNTATYYTNPIYLESAEKPGQHAKLTIAMRHRMQEINAKKLLKAVQNGNIKENNIVWNDKFNQIFQKENGKWVYKNDKNIYKNLPASIEINDEKLKFGNGSFTVNDLFVLGEGDKVEDFTKEAYIAFLSLFAQGTIIIGQTDEKISVNPNTGAITFKPSESFAFFKSLIDNETEASTLNNDIKNLKGENSKNTFGVHLKAGYEHFFNDNFFISPELELEINFAKIIDGNDSLILSSPLHTNLLLRAGYEFKNNKSIYLLGGAQYRKLNISYYSMLDKSINQLNFIIGTGAEIKITEKLGLYLEYAYAISNKTNLDLKYKDTKIGEVKDFETITSSLKLGARYHFGRKIVTSYDAPKVHRSLDILKAKPSTIVNLTNYEPDLGVKVEPKIEEPTTEEPKQKEVKSKINFIDAKPLEEATELEPKIEEIKEEKKDIKTNELENSTNPKPSIVNYVDGKEEIIF